jgi:nitrite reductase/ring-hydroxylating ferredoxin subunit
MIVVGSVDEIPQGKLKHVEVKGKEIVISNIGGKFYTIDDRCGHYYRWVTSPMNES